ncbi:phosphohistidine phosphatase [Sinorhizobium kostiense]|uniref:Phosphohistidine phosphatase n=1 Tax=Sinorhizobium kostiense TaxID=76747 RepID=A0ABS4R5R7_9HYPH|nr:histidine phosphatase family protein [Sinorhizobium kostiense]MBP2238238.1 phosphohistidine phosphatase [Sinorhizobium kostiense]
MQSNIVPAFRLFLLRHARSGWALPGQRDFDRTLDARGYAEAQLTAEAAAARGIRPALILCSTATRCRQTAEPLCRTLGVDTDILYMDELYTGPVGFYRSLVAAHASRASLMLVGHNPMMEELLCQLLADEVAAAALGDGYPPAGLATIDFPARPMPGGIWMGTLSSLWVPQAEAAEGQ